jgi:hypothetical protein
MKFKIGDNVVIRNPRIEEKMKFKNHVGIIKNILTSDKVATITITDNESLNIYSPYGGKTTGYVWFEHELELYNVNKRLA